MNWSHRPRVAIVTGAGNGIGLEIARRLVETGCSVVLNDQDADLGESAARRLGANGGRCLAVPGDASDIATIHQMVATAVNHFGRVDMAVANAGVTLFGSFLEYSPEDFRRVLEVNLGGSFFLAQCAARQMKQQGVGGRILFMSSVTGHQAHKNLAAYGMTKAALEMLAKSLVAELSEYQITVNAVAPGATLTERTQSDCTYEKVWSNLTPLGRPASVKDVAHSAIFLLSEDAAHITGQTLVVDGGWTSISPSP